LAAHIPVFTGNYRTQSHADADTNGDYGKLLVVAHSRGIKAGDENRDETQESAPHVEPVQDRKAGIRGALHAMKRCSGLSASKARLQSQKTKRKFPATRFF
jgi:hypothetical protein